MDAGRYACNEPFSTIVGYYLMAMTILQYRHSHTAITHSVTINSSSSIMVEIDRLICGIHGLLVAVGIICGRRPTINAVTAPGRCHALGNRVGVVWVCAKLLV